LRFARDALCGDDIAQTLERLGDLMSRALKTKEGEGDG
jgi:hypothetical protein